MNRKRLPALLLALFMCISLLPLPTAFAEGSGAPVCLRFTSNRAGDTDLVTLIDDAGNPVLPLTGEDATYLLSPGIYSYFLIDPTGEAELIPVTPLVLDGSSPLVEIPLRGAQVPVSTPITAPAASEQTQAPLQVVSQAEPSEDAQAMPVVLRYDGPIDFADLTVSSSLGTVMQPYTDPETGRVQYQNYLLTPGQYSYWYHDPAGMVEDRQGSFTVTDSGMQFVDLDFSSEFIELCFSAAAVNPLYENVIRADFIPAPSISPEESLAQLLFEVDGLSANDVQRSMVAVYGAGPESTSRTYDASAAYQTAEAAGAALKRGLLQRQTQISIRVKTHIKPTKDIWWDMCKMIYNEAIKHTGAPTEGDYLRYEYGGVNCNGSAAGSEKAGEYYYQFIYSPLYFTTLAQESELDTRINTILSDFDLAGKSDEQIVRTVYRYLCEHVRYEEANDTLGFTAYSALVNGHAACQGFSTALYRLCLELGIDARVVTSSKMGHAWNIVCPDTKQYYAVDATWDAGKAPEAWKFYLRGRNSWQAEHTIGDEFADSRFDAYTFPNEDYGAGRNEGPVIKSVSLLFDGLLQIKYYFLLPDSLLQEAGTAIQFSRGGEESHRVLLTDGEKEGEYTCFYCSVSVEDIAAPIQTRIVKKDGSYETISSASGTLYPNGFFFSPMEYARQMKTAASTTTMRALAQALEDYGIAAQNYFKGEQEALRSDVKNIKAEELAAWTIETDGQKPQGFNSASISVMFEADNSLRLYLSFASGSDLRRFSFAIDGQSAAPHEKDGSLPYLSVDNIGANALDTIHSFAISDGDNTYTIRASVLGYAKTAIEHGKPAMVDLAKALYLYNRAAEDYFRS